LKESLRIDRATNAERLLALEASLSQSQEKALVVFETRLKGSISEADSRLNTHVSQRSKQFMDDLSVIASTKDEIEKINADTEEMLQSIEAKQREILARTDKFETLLHSYQSLTEERFSGIERMPSGTIIMVGGENSCPDGYSRFSRMLVFAFERDSGMTNSRDFVEDSSFDLGTATSGNTNILAFVDPKLPGHNRSYDGKVVYTCQAN